MHVNYSSLQVIETWEAPKVWVILFFREMSKVTSISYSSLCQNAQVNNFWLTDWEISTHGHLLCRFWASVDWHRTRCWGGCGSAHLPSLWWAGSRKKRDAEVGTRHTLSSHQAPQLTVISASNSVFNHEEIKSWCQSFHDPNLKHMSLLGSQAITTYKCKPMWWIITVFSKNNFIFAKGHTPACVLACVCTFECKHLRDSERGIGSRSSSSRLFWVIQQENCKSGMFS